MCRDWASKGHLEAAGGLRRSLHARKGVSVPHAPGAIHAPSPETYRFVTFVSLRVEVEAWRISSLPLMGIGNLGLDEDTRRVIQLITPHGDRKQQAQLVFNAAKRISLPLMGIGNRSTSRPMASSNGAHYPSWGSETRLSLPVPVRLITPHGDRKRASSRSDRVPENPHYPSWGSETSRSRVHSPRDSMRLITPHGDRKPGRHAAPGPSDSELITPHGDRKRTPRAAGLTWDGTLITPHGDWKHFRLQDILCLTYGGLITPHGDRKLGSWRTARRSGTCSLPLMGIGNGFCTPSPPPWAPSHYPSWGSETGFDRCVQVLGQFSLGIIQETSQRAYFSALDLPAPPPLDSPQTQKSRPGRRLLHLPALRPRAPGKLRADRILSVCVRSVKVSARTSQWPTCHRTSSPSLEPTADHPCRTPTA